jgi:hypothetical protein
MRLSRRAYVLLVLVGVSASLSVVVYATVSQLFPAVTVPSLTFATHQNCPTLNVQNAPAPGAGTMIANCLSGTSQVAAGIAADGSGCGSIITTLTSGTAVSFSGAASYIYCLTYTAANTGGAINQFQVNWSP